LHTRGFLPRRRRIHHEHRRTRQPSGTAAGGLTLVVPDVPPLGDLFHTEATVTSRIGYLRLHSRNAAQWYAGGVQTIGNLSIVWLHRQNTVQKVQAHAQPFIALDPADRRMISRARRVLNSLPPIYTTRRHRRDARALSEYIDNEGIGPV